MSTKMEITYATASGEAEHSNEDLVLAGPKFAVVLDGATAPAGESSGCIHDVRWFVRQLGGRLVQQLVVDDKDNDSLVKHLRSAITWVNSQHEHTCDLSNPSCPSSTVAVLRLGELYVDALVLSDSTILLDMSTSGIQRLTDERTAHLSNYKPENVQRQRNQLGGFWVASTKPEAADHALSITVPIVNVRRAAVLTDGAARLVERFDLMDWPGLFKMLDTEGPARVIRHVREAENTICIPPGIRGKTHDDASAVLIHFNAGNRY